MSPAPETADRRSYDRRTELPRILPLWPHELADESPQGRQHVLCRLRRALRAERRRGIAGHWTYDLSRHVELLRVYRLELAAFSSEPVIPEAEGQPDAIDPGSDRCSRFARSARAGMAGRACGPRPR